MRKLEIAQHILQNVQIDKSCAASIFYEICR